MIATRRLIKQMVTGLSPAYYKTTRHIKKTERATESVLKAIQLERLQRVLIHAYEHVPYYRATFRRAGVDPYRFSDLSDIQEYPLLSKDLYRDNIDALTTSKVARRLSFVAYTGGTTGIPLKLYRSVHDFSRGRAYEEHACRMMGVDPSAKTVRIRGKVDDARGIYHAVGARGRTLYLSSNKLDDDNLKLYIQLMRDFQPVLLYALPSVAAVLAEYMERNHLPPIESIKYALLPSENLYDFQKRCIEQAFRCTIHAFYGQAERVVLATGCTSGPLYHVFPLYGYTELLDENGQAVTEEGGRGEIVGTSLGNSVSPLIRYRTGDYAVYTRERCPCGRNYQMWRTIHGRQQSVAVAKNRSRVSVGPELLCTLHDEVYGKIKQFQVRQERVGELDISVAPLDQKDLGEIATFFGRFFDDHFPGMFRIQVVHNRNPMDLTPGDKHLYFVQCLQLDEV